MEPNQNTQSKSTNQDIIDSFSNEPNYSESPIEKHYVADPNKSKEIEAQERINTVKNELKDEARNTMIKGAFICIIGIVVTAFTYSMASGGGRYVVAYGAIIYGAIIFVKGLLAHKDL